MQAVILSQPSSLATQFLLDLDPDTLLTASGQSGLALLQLDFARYGTKGQPPLLCGFGIRGTRAASASRPAAIVLSAGAPAA